MAKQVSWFRLNRALHRDIGYFCIGLTLIFSISGIALNHVEDWNPNYQVTHKQHIIADLSAKVESAEFPDWLLKKLDLDTTLKAEFWESPSRYKLFTKANHTLIVNPKTNSVTVEQIEARPLLRSLNFLHLNEARKAWTYFSDLYAAMLIYLALSALFMVRGKKGVWGKRGVLVVAGFAAPAFFVFLYAQ